jgi:hypothetical protein
MKKFLKNIGLTPSAIVPVNQCEIMWMYKFSQDFWPKWWKNIEKLLKNWKNLINVLYLVFVPHSFWTCSMQNAYVPRILQTLWGRSANIVTRSMTTLQIHSHSFWTCSRFVNVRNKFVISTWSSRKIIFSQRTDSFSDFREYVMDAKPIPQISMISSITPSFPRSAW